MGIELKKVSAGVLDSPSRAGAVPTYPTAVHMLVASASANADREALVCDLDGPPTAATLRLTYRDYLHSVAGLAHELRALGVQGERVAIVLPNSVEMCIAVFSVLAAGGVVVPLNPLYTERELGAILADADPRALIFDAARAGDIESLAARLGVRHRLPVAIGSDRLTSWAQGANEANGNAQPAELPQPLPDADALAFIQYTGGTTGRSKGVMLTHGSFVTNIAQREGLLPTFVTPLSERDSHQRERILCPMPIFHSYGLTMGLALAAYCGGTLVVMPRYRPDALFTLIEREAISIFPGSPTIFTGLMAHQRFASADWSGVHTCYSGSAPLSLETLQRWEQVTGAPIYEGYGQTEAGPILTYNPVNGTRKPGTVGIALDRTEVQIVDVETGTRVLGTGERGEIRARGPQIMRGYRNLPDETAASLREGWLYTGDIGEFDAEGYLTIRDRKKDMAIVGGYNVYPREIDEVLFMHPAVLDAAAVGVADAYRGEVIRAYVTLRQDASATREDLLAHCARNLAKYKVPVSIEILEALPKTTVNKTDKVALRSRGVK